MPPRPLAGIPGSTPWVSRTNESTLTALVACAGDRIPCDGELHDVGIDQDPEDMVANALSDWIQLR